MGILHSKHQPGSQIIGGRFGVPKEPWKKTQQKILEAPLFWRVQIAFLLRALRNLSAFFFLPQGDSREFYRHGHLCSGDSLTSWLGKWGGFVCWLVGLLVLCVFLLDLVGCVGRLVVLGLCVVWSCSRWWFETLFMFTPMWGNDPIWLIFFKWVETTN